LLTTNVSQAALALRNGELVAFATETVYGLGADAGNQAAVQAVYRTKGRPANHPLIVHVSGMLAARYWIGVSAALEAQFTALAKVFWPGSLSIVVGLNPEAAKFACAGQSTVGLRCPKHPQALELLAAFEALGGKGVAAPSANRFGKVSPTRAQHVIDDLGDDIHLVLDGGECEVGIESSIVGLFESGPVLLRPGAVSAQQLALVLGVDVGLPADASLPQVSGSLASHYSPNTPVELIAPASLAWRLTSLADTGERFAVFSRQQIPTSLRYRVNLLWEQAPNTASQYAHVIYDALRRMDALSTARIIIEDVPSQQEPLWEAIGDRLKRCAHAGSRTR
jgi:L-threonylcarbamoyladenylate synthase